MIVRELIAALSLHNGNLPVVIDDADTSWRLNISHVEVTADAVEIGGEYTDIFQETARRVI